MGQLKARNEEGKQKLPNNNGANGGNNVQFNPRVEFPIFDGNDPRGWTKKCINYFGLCRINVN